MLKKTELEKIKQDLLTRKAELEEELQRLSSEKVSDTGSQDDADQVVSVTMEALRNSLQDAEFGEYNMIIAALNAIEQGTYGVCRECGEDISPKRLKYYPNARRCIPCQEQAEELEAL